MRTSRTSCWVAALSGRCTGATLIREVLAPAGCGGAIADTSGSRLIRADRALTCGELAAAPTTTSTGEVPFGGNSCASVSSTCRALALCGSRLAVTLTNLMPVNGSPSAISNAVQSAAIRPGRRITNRDSRYQRPYYDESQRHGDTRGKRTSDPHPEEETLREHSERGDHSRDHQRAEQ